MKKKNENNLSLHSAGPWTRNNITYAKVPGCKGMAGYDIVSAEGRRVATCNSSISDCFVVDANVELIARSPDFLKFITEYIKDCKRSGWGYNPDLLKKAKKLVKIT